MTDDSTQHGVRKRGLSLSAEESDRHKARRRLTLDPSAFVVGDCLPSAPVYDDSHSPDEFLFDQSVSSSSVSVGPPSKPRLPALSRTNSFADLLCGPGLIRRASSQSLTSISTSDKPPAPTYNELSAKHNLRNTKATIDYTPTQGIALCVSAQNTVFFTRSNRVHFKSLFATTGEDVQVGQLCKLQDSLGDLFLLDCTGDEHLALSTSTGVVQIYDIRTKKLFSQFSSSKGVSAMKYSSTSPSVLTIGSSKGHIRYYDTRISPASKMKEQSRKLTRHQSRITSFAYSPDGRVLASGDESGNVFCWDQRGNAKTPLDIGEFVQRRKKISHSSVITAVAWCPWQSKILATGDESGTVRLWNVDRELTGSNAIDPGKIESGNKVVGVHFSPQCKEFLVAYGGGAPASTPASTSSSAASSSVSVQPPRGENTLSVFSYPGCRPITSLSVSAISNLNASSFIAESVLNHAGTKLVLALPSESKLAVCDVWGKTKTRSASFVIGRGIR